MSDTTPEQRSKSIAAEVAWSMMLSGRPLTDDHVRDLEKLVLERLLAAEGTDSEG